MKVIGIDLGGTSLKGGLVDFRGNIIKKLSMDTPDSSKMILEGIVSLIDQLSTGEDILGVGIGSAGFIDSNKGQVLSFGGNIPNWEWTKIKDYLLGKFPNQLIEIENDGNVAALCEKWIGSSKNMDNFIMLIIGTGLGGAIYTQNEEIWNGYNFQGGEFGHAILYPEGRLCKCGQEGCVERYVSGTAIEWQYESLTNRNISGEEIFEHYYDDMNAKKVINNFSKNLAIYLISLKSIFDPQGIVIGGGLINSSKYWWNKMIVEFNHRVNFPSDLSVVPATYLNDSGIIGAAKLIVDKR